MNQNKFAGIIKGLLLSYLVTAVFLILLSIGLWKLNLPEAVINGGMIILYIVSVFLGGWYLGKKFREKKFLWGMILGVCYVLLWLAASMIAGGPSGILNQNTITVAIICILSGTLGGMVA